MAKKNRASDTINKATPMFNPLFTAKVLLPNYVASEIMSLNQNDIDETREIKANSKKLPAQTKPCIVKTPDEVRFNKLILLNNGQGDGDTKW